MIYVPQKIKPFRSDRADFERAIAEAFIKEDYAPNDIFASADFQEAIATSFVPVYCHRGWYSASWDCMVGEEVEVARVVTYTNGVRSEHSKTETQWFPRSGHVRNNFELDTVACVSGDVPGALWEFATNFSYTWSGTEPFRKTENYDPLPQPSRFFDAVYSAEQIWTTSVRDRAEKIMHDACEAEKPSGDVRGFHIYNASVLQTETSLIYAPFWGVDYTYRGISCFAEMDGDASRICLRVPVDQDRVKKVKFLYRMSLFSMILFIVCFITSFPLSGRSIVAAKIVGCGVVVFFILWSVLYVAARIAEAVIVKRARKERIAFAKRIAVRKGAVVNV